MNSEQEILGKLRAVHRVNRIMWYAVAGGALVLIVIGLIMAFVGISGQSVVDAFLADRIAMFIVIICAVAIIYVKRTYLAPAKIIERAGKKELNVAGDVQDLIQQLGKENTDLAKAMIIFRRYYMLTWALADLIVISGFVYFILTGNLESFIIYAVVAAYSIAINFPSYTQIESIYYRLNE